MTSTRFDGWVWRCLHGDPPCRPGDRCSDGCSWNPPVPPANETQENER